MDDVLANVLPTVYDYKEKVALEEVEEAKDVMKEYRIDKADPGRKVITWEKSVQCKRRSQIIKDIRMINKGKFGIVSGGQ